MINKKKFYLVIDTETCNSLDEPLCYDIGYAICDRQGKIYLKRSFVVAELFLDYKDLMNSCYYHEKIPKYWDDIKSGKRIVKSIFNIRKQIKADMESFNIKEVGAYNIRFDRTALNNTIRYCSKSLIRWFFPYNPEYFCIWNMACNLIMNQVKYIKFAVQNGLVSDSDNVLTSAEACYQFLTNNIDFVECHTGLEDVEIEVKIMAECYKKHKKLTKEFNPSCWQIPQKKRKEMNI